ncbi:MAG: restriction endonuclease subunit S [Bradyrhizobium sp.]
MADGGVLGEREDFVPCAKGPWPLPAGWCWTNMEAVAAINPATNFDTLDPSSEIPFVPMAAVAEETGRIDFSAQRPVRDVSKGYVRFREGDVIFAKITPCMENGKVAPVHGLSGGYAAGSTEFHVLRPAAVDQRYLWYWLVSRAFRGRAQRKMSGSAGQLRVPADWLREVDFPLAPLAEQRRIVAQVDELFAEIADGEAALEKARKGLDTFRRALLKAAVTGELTKDWRAANPVTETGHDLLARIARESTRKGVRKSRAGIKACTPDRSILPELPDGWVWSRLSDLGEFGRGRSRHRPRDDARLYGGTMPFVQTGIIANADDYIRSYTQTYSEFGVQQSRVWPPGTLCITIAANIAKTAITTFDCCFPDSVVGLIPVHQVDPYWVHVWIKTIQHRLERFAPATAQKNINLEVLDAVMVPIPPPAEAAEILRRVSEALFASADTVAVLDAEAADAARLKQSILKAAFEGRLVPQDSVDERASALLARVAATSDAPGGRRVKARGGRKLSLKLQ